MNLNANLNKSYKNFFPFKIGTTSYIYPDHILPNVIKLGPFFDEIELLLFESIGKDNLLSKNEIAMLVSLADKYDIIYNIHLPIDVFLGDFDPLVRHYAVETINKIIDQTRTLPVSTYTLHLSYNQVSADSAIIQKWQNNLHHSLEKIISSEINSSIISIETLMYPFDWIENIISDFDCRICMDLGHLMLQNIELKTFFDKYYHKVSIIHLHGVYNGHDHVSLKYLSPKQIDVVYGILKSFFKTVSIEVFSFKNLISSINVLEKLWYNNFENELKTR